MGKWQSVRPVDVAGIAFWHAAAWHGHGGCSGDTVSKKRPCMRDSHSVTHIRDFVIVTPTFLIVGH